MPEGDGEPPLFLLTHSIDATGKESRDDNAAL